MSSIEDLKSAISNHGGISKANRYKVYLPSIPGMDMSPSDRDVFCTSVSLPGKSFSTVEKAFGGKVGKVVHGQVFVETSMTFLVPNNYSIRNYFHAWQRLAFDPDTLEPGYKEDYAKSVKVWQLSAKDDSVIYELELRKAYPQQIGDVTLTNDLNGLVSLNVTFAFDRYTERYFE